MKYYIYISDTKVDMLAAQIPAGFRQRVATEMKIDLKVFSISLAQAPADETRYSKTALVERYLSEHGLGTVEESRPYFEGTLEMAWGTLTAYDQPVNPIPIVWFAGLVEETSVALAGSVKHLLGETSTPRPEGAWGGYSGEAAIAGVLGNLERLESSGSSEEPQRPEGPLAHAASGLVRDFLDPSNRLPRSQLQFVARRLVEDHQSGTKLLLGSPLYVAYAD